MGTITRDCPHCHSRSMTFQSFAEFKNPNSRPNIYLTAFHCGGCHKGLFAEIIHGSGHSPHQYPGNIDISEGLNIVFEYPLPTEVESPLYLPENIQKFYIQAAHSLNGENFDASAMMSRKVLEVAVKTINPSGTGKLYNRIEQLHSDGKITTELKDWAHIIRDDGNEAAHEETPVTKEFADELLSFTQLFLMYTFTMPGMVNEKKGESESGE